MTAKDPIVQCGERNIENFKPFPRQQPEKAKQGADRTCFLHKGVIFEANFKKKLF